MTSNRDSWWRRALLLGGRVLRLVATAALVVEASYVVAVNVFLSTPLFDKVVNATPDAVDIHYARGWSVFPTRIHAKNLSIRGTDSHIEWILRLDEVEFECSLSAILRREFRVTMAQGSGISFRLRFKEESPAATATRARELPDIDSLGPVGLRPSGPPSADEWDDAQWHLWTVSIRGAMAEHVREIWIEDARFTGDADVNGGFYLKPIRSVQVGPVTLAVRSGGVAVDSRVVADDLAMSATVTVDRFDPRSASPAVHMLSLAADGSLDVPDVGALGLTWNGAPLLSGKVSVPNVTLRVVDGVLRDGSAVHASARTATVNAPSCAVSGSVDAAAEGAKDTLSARLLFEGLRGCA
jgi:hypothetical protein